MAISELRNIGLTEGESKVYVELLKLGVSTKTPIAYNANVSSSKVYEILDRLVDKGLVSVMIKNNVKHYQAAPPEKLNDYLKRKKKELKKEEKIIEKLIPDMEKFTKNQDKFSAKLYSGFEGVKTAMNSIAEEKRNAEYLAMGIISSKNKVFNRQWVHWHNKRSRRGHSAKLIFSEENKSDYYKSFEKIPGTKLKRLTLFTPAAITLFQDHVLIFDYDEDNPSCLVIENKNMFISFKSFFESVWKIAK